MRKLSKLIRRLGTNCSKIKKGRLGLVLIGFFAFAWFLVRVIPKPSRVTYPCQRAAFPVATGFLIWLIGILSSIVSLKKIKKYRKKSGYPYAYGFAAIVLMILVFIQLSGPSVISFARDNQLNFVDFNPETTESTFMPKAEVAIIQSVKTRAEDLFAIEIENMVNDAVQLAGGMDDIVADGDVVVIKPNLVRATQEGETSSLRREVNGVTTDPRVIQAVINLVRKLNPHGQILIMEGSAFGNTYENMEKMGWLNIKGVDQFTGIEDACGEMRNYNSGSLTKKSLNHGKNLYKSVNNIYYLNKIYAEADVVISLPILKTHSSAAYTGAIKNVAIGTMPANIYGDETGETNLRWPFIDHTSSYNSPLHDWIHDYYMCRPVDFVIMDALTGLEYGPGFDAGVNQDDVRKSPCAIIAGKDALAVDAIGALAVQVDPEKLKYLVTLDNDEMGCADTKFIRVLGTPLDNIRDTYRNHSTYARYTDFSPPKMIIETFELTNDTLIIHYKASDELEKIEILVHDVLMEKNYSPTDSVLKIGVGNAVSGADQIKLIIYDKYLNHDIIHLNEAVDIRYSPLYTNGFEVYPNPFTDHIRIKIMECNEIAEISLFVCDLSGRFIKTISLKDNNIDSEIDLSELKEGIYLIGISTEKGMVSRRIVKR